MEWWRQERPAKDETPEMVGKSPRPPWMEENCRVSQDSAWVVALIKKKKNDERYPLDATFYLLLISIMTVKHNNAFFINLLFYKLQDVSILTTCFGHRMTIIRSTRATMYMFLLCNDPNTFHSKISLHNKNMYMIALVDLMMVIRWPKHVVNIKTSCNL